MRRKYLIFLLLLTILALACSKPVKKGEPVEDVPVLGEDYCKHSLYESKYPVGTCECVGWDTFNGDLSRCEGNTWKCNPDNNNDDKDFGFELADPNTCTAICDALQNPGDFCRESNTEKIFCQHSFTGANYEVGTCECAGWDTFDGDKSKCEGIAWICDKDGANDDRDFGFSLVDPAACLKICDTLSPPKQCTLGTTQAVPMPASS
jgi:hypothetical protein